MPDGASDRSFEKYEITFWLRDHCAALATVSFGHVLKLVLHFLRSPELGILGKRAGHIVPFPLSEACERSECARYKRPYRLRTGEVPVSSLQQFRDCLEQLLHQHGGCLQISRLKEFFRGNFRLELVETVFGYTNIHALLQDDAISDLFEVRHTSRGDLLEWK